MILAADAAPTTTTFFALVAVISTVGPQSDLVEWFVSLLCVGNPLWTIGKFDGHSTGGGFTQRL